MRLHRETFRDNALEFVPAPALAGLLGWWLSGAWIYALIGPSVLFGIWLRFRKRDVERADRRE